MKESNVLFPTYLAKMFTDYAALKALGALLGAFAAFVLPTESTRNAALMAFGLILLDALTGTVAAVVTGHAITSAKMSRTLVKIIGYTVAGFAVALCFRGLPGMVALQEPAVTAIVGLVIVTEVISVFENLKRMGVPLPTWIAGLLQQRENPISGVTAESGRTSE